MTRAWLGALGGAFLAVAAWAGPSGYAPGRVTDLRVSAVTDTTAVLTWTEVPSGTSGVARYAVRTGPLGSYAWGSAPDVITGGCAVPVYGSTAAGGRTRSCVLGGLTPGFGVEAQVVAFTGSYGTTTNISQPSNVAFTRLGQRVGPLLVYRGSLPVRDSVTIVAVEVSDWPGWRLTLRGTFLFGDRRATFYDSTGAVAARAYLVVTPP